MFKITPAQCRAARALLGWPKEWLASELSVSTGTIAEFEKGRRAPRLVKLDAIRRALGRAGIEFIDDGQGVRLKPPLPSGVEMSDAAREK